MTLKTIHITLSVSTDTESKAVQIAEQLGRQAVGFGLDGDTATISITTYEDEDEVTP